MLNIRTCGASDDQLSTINCKLIDSIILALIRTHFEIHVYFCIHTYWFINIVRYTIKFERLSVVSHYCTVLFVVINRWDERANRCRFPRLFILFTSMLFVFALCTRPLWLCVIMFGVQMRLNRWTEARWNFHWKLWWSLRHLWNIS